MSSLQKFHRRTASFGPPPFAFTTIGSGDITHGFWLGGVATNRLVVSPVSTETSSVWGVNQGNYGAGYGASSLTAGLSNSNIISSVDGTSAARYCRSLTTGGYNTWYLPAQNEMLTLYSNKSATPFATANGFGSVSWTYWTSTEYTAYRAGKYANFVSLNSGSYGNDYKDSVWRVRAVRRSLV